MGEFVRVIIADLVLVTIVTERPPTSVTSTPPPSPTSTTTKSERTPRIEYVFCYDLCITCLIGRLYRFPSLRDFRLSQLNVCPSDSVCD